MNLETSGLAGEECGAWMEPRLGLLVSEQGDREPCLLAGHVLGQLVASRHQGQNRTQGENNIAGDALVSLGTISARI